LQKSVLKRNIVRLPKVSQKIGRLTERYPAVARYYDINIAEHENEAGDITWSKKPLRQERSSLTEYTVEKKHPDRRN